MFLWGLIVGFVVGLVVAIGFAAWAFQDIRPLK